MIAVHLYDCVRDVEKRAGASGNQDRGNTACFKQLSGPLDKRGNGFLFAVDDLLHQLVPDHKVGGAGVLVDEEGAAAGEHAFHNSGSLGGGSAGVLGGEMAGVLSVWKIIDKQGNIGVFDVASILRPQLDCCGISDYILPPVPCNVAVNAHFQGL